MKKMLLSIHIAILAITLVSPTTSFASNKHASNSNEECVIFLHGLARTNKSFKKMASALKSEGFNIVNYNYPSTKYAIETLANRYVKDAIYQCRTYNPKRIHFVTHSMGGILVRQYLSQKNISRLGNIVMLSPPNNGSEIIDSLNTLSVFSYVNIPSAKQLNTSFNSVPVKLGATSSSVGVITGNRSLNLFLSLIIPGEDDGKVSVESAKLDGMSDFLVVPHTHIFIMNSDYVIKQTHYFLRYATFDRKI